MYGNNIQDYLISVPCSCMDLDDNTTAYFYNTTYPVQHGDTFDKVSIEIYSGQAWKGKANYSYLDPKNNLSISLPCGCIESQSQTVVTYTVQDKDTLLSIASLLSSDVTGIQSLNQEMVLNPSNIGLGWVLFVPLENNPKKVSILIIVVLGRKRSKQKVEDPRAVARSMSAYRTFLVQNQYQDTDNMEDSERPVLFSPEEIEEATSFFNESRKIGEGGYGSVYFGILGGKEVAIKKMRSNKSKEFFAELKVLCKIHHINVVELLGYASGEDDLYLVYEFTTMSIESGHQPLSWTASTQIELDAAKGIEYIRDHTKSRYVHRDIKTSNILFSIAMFIELDAAKGIEYIRDHTKSRYVHRDIKTSNILFSIAMFVADFGLVKLVGRTNEGDFLATRLVGTPDYLPPEQELQVTPKTDVFAFRVVLAELITGQHALICDSKETYKMKSLITVINNVFQDEHPEDALEAVIEGNLRGIYPFEHVYKMAEIAQCFLSEDVVDRPEMREIVVSLSNLVTYSIEWEASLGGNSQVFSGLFNGR
ncbi:lysm domain receptor-like kinase 3 [Quercus suber]|uniref:Lysm domain receptor-like kinase 3 n=1 Tax=Quercus suber TaxID=58331 RepID=A0AAW0LYT4_QUESU